MAIEVVVHFAGDRLRVEVPEVGLQRECANAVVMERRDKNPRILTVGETVQSLEAIGRAEGMPPEAFEELARHRDVPILSMDAPDGQVVEAALRFFAYEAILPRRKIRFWESFDYRIEWPQYDELSASTRVAFQRGLARWAHSLVINGVERRTRWRAVELLTAAPLVVAGGGFIAYTKLAGSVSRMEFFAGLGAVFAARLLEGRWKAFVSRLDSRLEP
jgi:hypothetical protein